MKKELSIMNALEEQVKDFANRYSACQQESMSHAKRTDPFMEVHDQAEQSNVPMDNEEAGYQMCGIITKNAISGVPNNHVINFRSKVHIESHGPTEIDSCIMMLCPIGSDKPCFIYLDKTEVFDSMVLVNGEHAYLLSVSANDTKLLQLSEFHILSYSLNTVFEMESGLFTSFSSSVKKVYSEYIQSSTNSLGPVKNLFLSLWTSSLREKAQESTHIAEGKESNE